MSQSLLQQADTQKSWKTAFIILSLLIVIAMPLLSRNYGQSGDEWLQIEYGQHIWNYFTKGDPQALDYSQRSLQYQGQEYYGGLYDFSMNVVSHWFPSIPIHILRHFFNALTGVLMMIFTGLIAFRISKKWSIGFLALLFIVFSPRIFGESMNNPKDIPYAAGFTMGMYYILSLLQEYPRKRWWYAVGAGIGMGIAYGVRPAGGILLIAYYGLFAAFYYFLNKDIRPVLRADNNKLLKQLIIGLILALVIGFIIGITTWPWGLQSPIERSLESLHGMTNRVTQIPVFFDGQYYPNTELPKIYEFKWIFISNPLIVFVGLLLFVIMIFGAYKRYGLFSVAFLLFGAIFPLLYMIYKDSTVYDSWRHVFFVYPYWVVMGALGFDLADRFVEKQSKYKWAPIAVAAIGLLPAIIWTVRTTPNQYVYFNESVGGVKGADGNYDLDYYHNTGLQGAKWILENAKPIPGKKVEVRTNMSGLNNYLAKDTAWIEGDYMRASDMNTRKDWDYYIMNPRFLPEELLQDDNWTKIPGVVHVISVDGVPLSEVIKREDMHK